MGCRKRRFKCAEPVRGEALFYSPGVSFFEPPPPPEVQEHRQPEWIGPPENVLPASFPLALTLARTDDVAIAAQAGLAYPNGFAFRILLLRRKPLDAHRGDPFHLWHRARSGDVVDEALRFGVQFSDGAKATLFDAHRWLGVDDKPAGPVLMQRGGSGGIRSWDFGFWVWPLPPDGPLAFVVEWPSEGVALTRAEIDAGIVRAASEQAEVLWPDDDGPSSAGGAVFSRQIR
jgi:hypothetical protein